jgi:outer membrane protein TolC
MKARKRVPSESVVATPREAPGVQAATQESVSAEEIARRAYEIYQEGGRVDGRALADWLQAERELLGRP